jgi:serine/threonine protein kinase
MKTSVFLLSRSLRSILAQHTSVGICFRGKLSCMHVSLLNWTPRTLCRAEIKATDFGLSIFFKPKERFNDLVGSPYYVAPEVLKKNYSYEADLWSLGVILYILLSGLPPFWGDNEEQIFKMVLKGHVDFATEPWPKISSQAKDLVTVLLSMDATRR